MDRDTSSMIYEAEQIEACIDGMLDNPDCTLGDIRELRDMAQTLREDTIILEACNRLQGRIGLDDLAEDRAETQREMREERGES